MINRLIPIPFFKGNVRPPFFSQLAAWYKGDLINIDGLYYLKDYSGNEYHAPVSDSLLYLNGTDNTVEYGSVTANTDWTIGMALILPTEFVDATEYAIFSADNIFIGHKNGDGHGIRFTVTIDAVDYSVDASSVILDDGQQHSIIASFRMGNQITIYIDGELIGNTNIGDGGETPLSFTNVYLGSVDGASAFTEMYIPTLEILGQYMTIAEVDEYNKLLLKNSIMVFDIIEGKFDVVEYGDNIIESV